MQEILPEGLLYRAQVPGIF
uniref:Uncharacterized protein n=1 Tax=Rhizophora mucronata TaxID=61149 RepID=A0A2P2QCV3_RHIMU